MNIAIISPWAISKDSVGGTERFIMDLASSLHGMGETVEVFMLSGKNRSIGAVKYTSLDILGNGQAADEYTLRSFAGNENGEDFYERWGHLLENAVDVGKFDVIHLNSLLFIDAWTDKPRIITIHTNPFEYSLDWGRRRLEQAVKKLRNGSFNKTALTVPSEHYGKHFSKALRQNVMVIPHAIEVSRLNKTRAASGHAKLNSRGETKVTILLPSRLEPVQKRPQIVFEGVAQLPKHKRERIEIVASGAEMHYRYNYRELKSFADKSGFNARFAVFPTMADAYSLADIVALPSRSESFGYAALESLALGIPTVLNNVPAYKEIGAGNDNAHFFKETAESFSQTLLEVLDAGRPRNNSVSESWLDRYNMGRWARRYQTVARNISSNE